nr:unnamed protein product [Callosobruchus chinensis]
MQSREGQFDSSVIWP